MASKYDNMGKDGLRAACRTAGVSYGKLNNQGMRDALRSIENEKMQKIGPKTNLERAIEHDNISGGEPVFGSAEPAPEAVVAKIQSELLHNVKQPAKASTSGFKIEKQREEKNGVKRPSIGGMCRAVWDALDSLVTAGASPVAKDVKALSEKNSWNINNASIEFYNWRRFNGITGRKKG